MTRWWRFAAVRDGVEHATRNGRRTTRSVAAWQLFFCEREAAASQIAWLRGEPANDTSLRALDRQVPCCGEGFSATPTGATERLCMAQWPGYQGRGRNGVGMGLASEESGLKSTLVGRAQINEFNQSYVIVKGHIHHVQQKMHSMIEQVPIATPFPYLPQVRSVRPPARPTPTDRQHHRRALLLPAVSQLTASRAAAIACVRRRLARSRKGLAE